MKFLDIPFIENSFDGNQCIPICTLQAMQYLGKTDATLEEMDQLFGRKKGKWTWTEQAAVILHDAGFKITFYNTSDLEQLCRGEEYIRERYEKKDAEHRIEKNDFPNLVPFLRKLQTLDIITPKKANIETIRQYFSTETVCMLILDWGIITDKKDGIFRGHCVTITGMDETTIYVHDSGPNPATPNKPIEISLFERAWERGGNELLVVSK